MSNYTNNTYHYNPAPLERIIAMLTYLNCWIGFIWLIIAAFLKKEIKPFMRYHIFQSIFIAFALFIIQMGLNLLVSVIDFIPVINKIVNIILNFFTTGLQIFFGYSVIQAFILLILVYLAIGAVLGKYSYLPVVSDIIKQNVR